MPARALENKTGTIRRKPASIPDPFENNEGGNENQGGEGYSASDDYLENVAVGTQTLLNAKEYKFYGFYERIRERLTDYWYNMLTAEIDGLMQSGRLFAGGDRETQVLVKLDARGQLQSVNVIGSSGIDVLDRAATNAFKSAAPFPNPPSGMIESDKSVNVRWDFVVMANDLHGYQVRVRRMDSSM